MNPEQDTARDLKAPSPVSGLPERFALADLEIDLGQHRVRRGGLDILLPKLSYDLLLALARASPNIMSVDDLMSAVWPGLVVNVETVTQRIKLLRDALGDAPQAPVYIASLRARGYRLVPPVRPLQPEPPPAVPAEAWPDEGAETAFSVSRPTKETLPTARKRFPLLLATAAVVIAIGGTLYWRHVARENRPAVPEDKGANVAVLPPRTVAVLPFDDLSLQRDNAPLAQAVPEMILQRLGTVKDLTVIARASSFSLAGRQLGARYLVEGSVQRAEDRLRVTAQLVDAQTGLQLRAVRFDRRVGEIFAMQDEIAAQFADALHVQLLRADMHRVDRARDTSLEVYLSYLEAQDHLNRWTVKESAEAVTALEGAVARDPGFALGYAELARAKWLNHFLLSPVAQDYHGALLLLVNKALQLDPLLGEAYIMRAEAVSDVDPKAAEPDFRRGLELAPNYGPGYQLFAETLVDEGRIPEAMTMIDQAIAIDPIAPRNLYLKARILDMQGKITDAEQLFQKAIDTGVEYPPALARMAENKWELGELAEGIKWIERALRAEPIAPWYKLLACEMYLDVDDREAAGQVAEGLPVNSDARTLLAFHDRNYRLAAAHQGDWGYAGVFGQYAYWASIGINARRDGKINETIVRLRTELSFMPSSTTVDGSSDDIGEAMQLVYLLNLKGDRASAAPLVRKLLTVAKKPENEGNLFNVVRLLAGDRESAIEGFAENFRNNHYHSWWLRQRDPMLDDIRDDPRYRAAFQIELDGVAAQRKLLESMRATGEVPRRDSKAAAHHA